MSPSSTKPHLYEKIKEEVLALVRSGELRPGERVPGDAELAEKFGCARMTAHRALRELAEEGVIERRRRSGSRVALRSGRTALFDIPRVDLEVESAGAVYGYRLLQRAVRRPPTDARRQLGLAQRHDRALWLHCLHYADELPFQLEHRWINLNAAPASQAESFRDVGPNRWLLEHVPWSRAEHVISSEAASAKAAQLLGIDRGAPLLVLERRTFLDQQVVTWARLLHPGASYRLHSAMVAPGT